MGTYCLEGLGSKVEDIVQGLKEATRENRRRVRCLGVRPVQGDCGYSHKGRATERNDAAESGWHGVRSVVQEPRT